MRNTRNRRWNTSQFSWWWVAIVSVLIAGIFLIKTFWGDNNVQPSKETNTKEYIEITPSENSTVGVSGNWKHNTKINKTEKLFSYDAYAYVDIGSATAIDSSFDADLDENTQIKYHGIQDNFDTIELLKGRMWIQAKSGQKVAAKMKNFSAQINNDNIALLEQTNNTFSTLYAIRGNIDIVTSAGQYSLPAGKRIMISASDLADPNVNLEDLSRNISEGITQNSVFTRNNGIKILEEATKEVEATENNNETLTNTGGTTINSQYIEFTQPSDGVALKTNKTTIMGNLLNTDVKKVTINDINTAVSPVDKTFIIENFVLKNEINNLVYKIYDANNVLLDKGVLVVYGPKWWAGDEMLVPTNYPINDAEFKINSPSTNPFKTTANYVKVRGTVPANTVEYIVVNNYRLKKYTPKSTNWYYHANANIGTMKDGMNLYEIKFYNAQNKLVSTRMLTIIKENPNAKTLSGEAR